jgi:hypothetical protein
MGRSRLRAVSVRTDNERDYVLTAAAVFRYASSTHSASVARTVGGWAVTAAKRREKPFRDTERRFAMKMAVLACVVVLGLMTSIPASAQHRFKIGPGGTLRYEPGANTVVIRIPDPEPLRGIMVRDRVLVPLRAIGEFFGAVVDYATATRTITLWTARPVVRLQLSSDTATVGDRQVALDVPAVEREGTAYVPLRFVGETLGADVDWRSETNTAHISSGSQWVDVVVR